MLETACPKIPPGRKSRREERAERTATRRQTRRDVYRAVDTRDGQRCRVCRARCSTTAMDMTLRAERHHIVPRSLGGQDTTGNLVTLCKSCHDERHTSGRLQLSGDADERNEMGKLCGVTVERLSDSGWKVEALV